MALAVETAGMEIILAEVGSIKLIQSPDRLIQLFQSNVLEAINPLTQNPLAQGYLLQNVALTTGITNVLPTRLNRPLTGWFVTRLNANSIIWDSQALNKTPAQNLQLLCSADCLIDIYVF